MSNYIFCARNIRNKGFGTKPGKTSYLILKDDAKTSGSDDIVSEKDFLATVTADPNLKDVVIYVHGTDMTVENVISRHKELKVGLKKAGYKGELITFDWPSSDKPLLYLDDRHDAKVTAMELVKSGIALLAKQQGRNCVLNVHAIAHSTGAYIIHEAFSDAETTKSTAEINWTLSQLILIGGDVSSNALSTTRGESVYRHCNRLTNYFNPYDFALAIANAKRVGFSNRAGRVGLPSDIPAKAVDVNCGQYFQKEVHKLKVKKGVPSHAWYFYSDVWFKDVFETIKGDADRSVIALRTKNADGTLRLT